MDGRTAAAVLGITPGATRDEIRRAFRARAKIVHPDAHGTDEAFVTLRAAADLLLAAATAAATVATVATGDGGPAPAPSAGLDGGAGRRAARWVQQPTARPGAAIDLTDRPAPVRRRPTPPTAPRTAGSAFDRVLEAELARH